ncbi:hypothetical protein IMCC3317_17860 [Kordia antarctica]|uniref:Ubiquitin-like domain-containing protein n=1 Tax=Kordia antarctica TaxID=1218801 RepID=A0A7L4ZI61_9FLAO|nr:hypothetical protein [Kordia antarctica]QHI36423.1 hypothetical protein IMCC3317_17860 [Kordia antarctica]
MADVTVNFKHPTDGRVISVTLDDSMTGQEVIGELIANEFVPASSEGYNIAIKGGRQLTNGKTLLENEVKDNDTIRVIPATDAGNITF